MDIHEGINAFLSKSSQRKCNYKIIRCDFRKACALGRAFGLHKIKKIDNI